MEDLWGINETGEDRGYMHYSAKWKSWSIIDKIMASKEDIRKLDPIQMGLMLQTDHIPLIKNINFMRGENYEHHNKLHAHQIEYTEVSGCIETKIREAAQTLGQGIYERWEATKAVIGLEVRRIISQKKKEATQKRKELSSRYQGLSRRYKTLTPEQTQEMRDMKSQLQSIEDVRILRYQKLVTELGRADSPNAIRVLACRL